MNEEKDWERLIHITDEYQEVNSEVPKNAINVINVRFADRKEAENKRKMKIVFLVFLAIVILVTIISILLPGLFHKEEEIIYFDDVDLSSNLVEDLPGILSDNNLNVKYYDNEFVTNYCTSVIETGQLAYITQNYYDIDIDRYNIIELNIQVIFNSHFQFMDLYSELNSSVTTEFCTVYYNMYLDESKTYAKFNYDNYNYYMTIESASLSEEQLIEYVKLLLM